MLPRGEIWLVTVTASGVMGGTGGSDDVCARAQQMERGRVADFDACTCYQSNAPGEISCMESFHIVEVSTGETEMMIEEVGPGEELLADVAATWPGKLRARGNIDGCGLKGAAMEQGIAVEELVLLGDEIVGAQSLLLLF